MTGEEEREERGSEGEGTRLKRGYCLHIKTLPLTPGKSSNLPCEVLQFNFSIVQRDNPLIIGEEVALSPRTEGEGSQRASVSVGPPLPPASMWIPRSSPPRRGHFACSLALLGCLGACQLALRYE